MADGIDGKKVAVLVANEGIEQVELTEPWQALEKAGAKPELIAPDAGEILIQCRGSKFLHGDRLDGRPTDRHFLPLLVRRKIDRIRRNLRLEDRCSGHCRSAPSGQNSVANR